MKKKERIGPVIGTIYETCPCCGKRRIRGMAGVPGLMDSYVGELKEGEEP
jgi:hypothetical protein